MLEIVALTDVDVVAADGTEDVCRGGHLPTFEVDRAGVLVVDDVLELAAAAVWETTGALTVAPLWPKYSVYVETTDKGVGADSKSLFIGITLRGVFRGRTAALTPFLASSFNATATSKHSGTLRRFSVRTILVKRNVAQVS